MFRFHAAAALLASGLLAANVAWADRVPSSKVQQLPNPGARTPLAVPYTTNGNSNLGVYQGVSPRIYSSPIVDDQRDPQARPVYNIPFYGAIQAFGDRSNGATPRPYAPVVPR